MGSCLGSAAFPEETLGAVSGSSRLFWYACISASCGVWTAKVIYRNLLYYALDSVQQCQHQDSRVTSSIECLWMTHPLAASPTSARLNAARDGKGGKKREGTKIPRAFIQIR